MVTSTASTRLFLKVPKVVLYIPSKGQCHNNVYRNRRRTRRRHKLVQVADKLRCNLAPCATPLARHCDFLALHRDRPPRSVGFDVSEEVFLSYLLRFCGSRFRARGFLLVTSFCNASVTYLLASDILDLCFYAIDLVCSFCGPRG